MMQETKPSKMIQNKAKLQLQAMGLALSLQCQQAPECPLAAAAYFTPHSLM